MALEHQEAALGINLDLITLAGRAESSLPVVPSAVMPSALTSWLPVERLCAHRRLSLPKSDLGCGRDSFSGIS
ncbi:MAG: hypothetical protein FJZ00_12450 [Candidatus Sericytochromatia bacterium]|uniref:Uncharacterized protein n=1 Tax=Candidatus Tanganyikabacteria bacterium TaxID=2961651 RepID=A0A937X9B6_9BACT|nr:hypothetical protein [Candidatus Tanganyikabacteria bacterium]